MGIHNIPDKLQDEQAIFPASGRAWNISSTETPAFMLAWGPTAIADASTGYGVGCTFRDTTTGAFYTNVGTSASSNFDAIGSTTAESELLLHASAISANTADIAAIVIGDANAVSANVIAIASNASQILLLESEAASNDSEILLLESAVSVLEVSATTFASQILVVESEAASNNSEILLLESETAAIESHLLILESHLLVNDSEVSVLIVSATQAESRILLLESEVSANAAQIATRDGLAVSAVVSVLGLNTSSYIRLSTAGAEYQVALMKTGG